MDAISKNNRTYFMGIAIILVILHHFCLRLDTCWHVDTFPFSQFYWGQIGVDIFFFLSAYGCCASYEHNKYLKYIWHRIYRIYPMYTFFLLIVLSFFFTDSSIIHRFKLAIFSLIGIAPIYKLGVYIEWYIPSLILMYLLLPFVFIICKKVNKWGGGVLVLLIMILPYLLKESVLYYQFMARFPVIICGIVAYINRVKLDYLIKLFSFCMILTLITREEMVIHSMMVPLLFVALSKIESLKLPFRDIFSFFGMYSMEIFLAQTITTQFIMPNYYWGDKWLSLTIIICLTILFTIIFRLVSFVFNYVGLSNK